MARIQQTAPVAATPSAKAPPMAPSKAPAAPVKASAAPVAPVAYVTREDFDLLKAMLGGMTVKINEQAETIAKLHKAAAPGNPGKGKLPPRAIETLLDCPNTGDWRDAWQDAARSGLRLATHHFRCDKNDEIIEIDVEATPKIPMLLCIPRDSEPEGAKARAQGLLASYSAFSEDGEHVVGVPACYLSEEEIGRIRAD